MDDENLWDDPVASDGMFENGSFVSTSVSRTTSGPPKPSAAPSAGAGANAPNSGLFANVGNTSPSRYVAPAARERRSSEPSHDASGTRNGGTQ